MSCCSVSGFGNTVVSPNQQEIHSKTPDGCLKLRIVLNHIYTIFSSSYIPMIKFDL